MKVGLDPLTASGGLQRWPAAEAESRPDGRQEGSPAAEVTSAAEGQLRMC